MAVKRAKAAGGAKRPAEFIGPRKPTGQAMRDLRELDTLDGLKRNGQAPAACGPDVVFIAPARGPVMVFQPTAMQPDGKDGYKVDYMGYRGRSAMRGKDTFDRMLEQCAKAKAPPPFTWFQIDAARAYRDLYEDVHAAGVKCSQAFDAASGGGGDFMDAYLRDSEQLRRLQARIGYGADMVVRRVRPSVRGTRRTISDRELVDCVCLGDRSVSGAMTAFGWSDATKNRIAARAALCAALDRMREIL